VLVRLPPDLLRALDERAGEEGTTRSAVLRGALVAALARKPRKGGKHAKPS
jgi:hypothetical protein